MPSFTWTHTSDTIPIAKDTEQNRILFLDKRDDHETKFGDNDDMTAEDLELTEVLKNKVSMKRLDLLRKHLIQSVEPLDSDMKRFYDLAQEKKRKEVSLRKGQFDPMPSGKGREVIYITAPSGAGKSTWVSKYSRNYSRLFPDQKIVLFSRLEDDEVLDAIPSLVRIQLDEELVENPIDIHTELKDCLVILDDIDTVNDKKIRLALEQLQDDCLQTGRHSNTSCLITSHLSTNYKSTRIVLAESHKVVIFPRASSAHSLRYLLNKYVGLEKQDISKVMKLPSRWVCIHRNYPRYVLGERQAYIV